MSRRAGASLQRTAAREEVPLSFPGDFGGATLDSRWEPGRDVKVTNSYPVASEHAGKNAFTMTTNYAAETLDLARMKIHPRKTITAWIEAQVPTSLTLRARRLPA